LAGREHVSLVLSPLKYWYLLIFMESMMADQLTPTHPPIMAATITAMGGAHKLDDIQNPSARISAGNMKSVGIF